MMRPYNQLMSLPNVLTLLRIVVIPILVIVYYLPTSWAHVVAAIIFAFACVTDWLDGYLARYLQQTTVLGAFLDPVADKLMVSIVLVLLVAEPTFQFVTMGANVISVPAAVVTVPAAIIVGREVIVSALREWMAELGNRRSVAVSSIGKIKTAVQMMALVVLLYCDRGAKAFFVFSGLFLLYIAAMLTLWSMMLYLRAAWAQLNKNNI
jgi:CDP-diacylglycerol--glycerol-3-phosphate 3-phosphatidyltransferase